MAGHVGRSTRVAARVRGVLARLTVGPIAQAILSVFEQQREHRTSGLATRDGIVRIIR